MRRAIALVACRAATVLVFAVGIAGAAEFTPVEGHEYSEFYDKPTPVSGVSIVGAMLDTGQSQSSMEVLWVYFKQPFVGQIDLEVLSADGRFLGRGAFKGSTSGIGEWGRLSLASPKNRAQRPPGLDQGAIAASVHASSRDTVLVSAWGPKPGQLDGASVRLFVNSRRAQMAVRVNPDPRVPMIQCERLGILHTVRFDTECRLRVADLAPDRKITLVRRDGMRTESQSVTLEL